jgi:hypothetical protein
MYGNHVAIDMTSWHNGIGGALRRTLEWSNILDRSVVVNQSLHPKCLVWDLMTTGLSDKQSRRLNDVHQRHLWFGAEFVRFRVQAPACRAIACASWQARHDYGSMSDGQGSYVDVSSGKNIYR